LSLARADGKTVESKCLICDAVELHETVDIPFDEAAYSGIAKESMRVFISLVKSQAFAESRRPRVLAMFALKRFAAHFQDPELLDLEASPLGQWCLMSLKSSIRELRLAAG
jgi:serine/threonine-protein kinase ATR